MSSENIGEDKNNNNSQQNKTNVVNGNGEHLDDRGLAAVIKDQNLATMIILGGFAGTVGLGGSLVLLAYFAIGNTDVSIQRARDIILVITPVLTLIIGSMFGFLAGRRTMSIGVSGRN